MSEHFTDAIRSELADAQDRIRIAINQRASEATLAGAHGGSRELITFQIAIVDEIGAYASILVERLTRHDVHHTPITLTDFDAASASIDDLRASGLAIYNEKLCQGEPWGTPKLPFDLERLERAVSKAKSNVAGHKSEFVSKRSFFKRFWAWSVEELSRGFLGWALAMAGIAGAALWALIGPWLVSLGSGALKILLGSVGSP